MNKLVIASLFALSALSTLAAAQPTPPTPPGPPAGRPKVCASAGGLLFEESLAIEKRPEMHTMAEKTWRVTVYGDGTWQRRDLEPGARQPALSNGCLPDDQVATIKAALAKATWIVNQHDVACAAVGTTFTSFSVGGKAVWAEHMCQTAYLDEASEQALQRVRALVDMATVPRPMPCCKH